jgi:hypothetical protein
MSPWPTPESRRERHILKSDIERSGLGALKADQDIREDGHLVSVITREEVQPQPAPDSFLPGRLSPPGSVEGPPWATASLRSPRCPRCSGFAIATSSRIVATAGFLVETAARLLDHALLLQGDKDLAYRLLGKPCASGNLTSPCRCGCQDGEHSPLIRSAARSPAAACPSATVCRGCRRSSPRATWSASTWPAAGSATTDFPRQFLEHLDLRLQLRDLRALLFDQSTDVHGCLGSFDVNYRFQCICWIDIARQAT